MHKVKRQNYLSSLRDGVLHDARHIGNREVDVLLSEIVFASVLIFVVVKTFIPVIYEGMKRLNNFLLV